MFLDSKGWCYSSSHGKKATNKEFTEYGAKVEKGDIVGAYLDYAEDNVTIQFTKNGEAQGEAFVFPAADLEGEALFPHICARNVRFQVNFGKVKDGKEKEPLKPCEAIEGYTQVIIQGLLSSLFTSRGGGSPDIRISSETVEQFMRASNEQTFFRTFSLKNARRPDIRPNQYLVQP